MLKNSNHNSYFDHTKKGSLLSFLVVALFVLQSCSSLHFKSTGAIDVSMGHHEEMDTFFEINSQRDFYLWGLYPSEHVVLLDEELASAGATEAVVMNFGIDNSRYWSSFFYQLFTFGMYRPEYYYIKAKGRKSNE